MTPVGHTLLGTAIGLALAPRQSSKRKTAFFVLGCAAMANAPDWPLPGWGHDRYDISHSVIVAVGILVVLASLLAMAKWISRDKSGNPIAKWFSARFLFAASLAWLSHFLLDSFYNHGMGVAIYWPFSRARLTLPIPWLETYKRTPLMSWPTWRVGLIETVCYLPLVLIALAWRAKRAKREQRDNTKITERHSP